MLIINNLGVPLLRRVATLRVSLRSWLRHRFAALQAAHAKTYTPKAELSKDAQIGRNSLETPELGGTQVKTPELGGTQ